MTRRTTRPGIVALVLALLLGVVVPAGLGGEAPATARGAATDLTLVTDATYTVWPDVGRVGVSVAIDVRNHTKETKTRRFWFDHAFLAVHPGATAIRLGGQKGARAKVVRRTPEATLVRLDFGARLYSGRRTQLRLTFDLPGAGSDASPQVRVGSGLVTLPVWAFASNGARGSTVTVRFPAGWDVAVESGELTPRGGDDEGTVLASGAIDRPLSWFAYVTAQRPATFVDRVVTVDAGGEPVELLVRGWEDDPGWADRVQATLTEALPVLRDEIGVPWPLTEPLTVQEAVSRDDGAPAARFDPAAGRVEIAYWADPAVVVQQAAHGWFNGSLVADRWVNEGFAAYYAVRAGERLEIPVEPPVMTPEAQAEAQPLNAWTPTATASTAADGYGLAASYALAGEIADRVGPDALARTWADVAAGATAYPAPEGEATAPAATPAPGIAAAPRDWRGLLDLLEARSGADLTALWRESVVTPEQAGLLDARAAARTSYERTLILAGEWRLPAAIRDALSAWDFELAEALMADARTVIAQRNAVAATASRDGMELPDTMRPLFEQGAMADASAQAEAERGTMVLIAEAAASRSADDDVLSRIGMIGENPDADLAAARTALAAGDLEASRDAADRAYRAWTAAWQEGRRRALLALAALATVLVLGSAVAASVRRGRRERRDRQDAEPQAPATA